MKKRFKTSLLAVCLSALLFCCAGCTYISPGNGDFDYVKHGDDELKPFHPHEGFGESTEASEEYAFSDGAFDDYISAWYGVRALYNPDATDESYLSSSSSQTILNDRLKFNDNAFNQYYFMARYVLTGLVDFYGKSVDNYTCFDYQFFADNSLLPDGASTGYNCVYNHMAVSTQDLCIQNDGWLCRLPDEMLTDLDNYLKNYLNAFAPYLALRFMESALGLPATQLNSAVDVFTGLPKTDYVNSAKSKYVTMVDKLGIGGTQDDFVDIVKNEIIGSDSLLNDLLYSYSVVVYGLINKFLDDIAPNFPTYTRLEFCDVDSSKFFTPGIKGEPTKLNNVPYAEYQSATFFYQKDQTPLVNTFFDICIDSRSDVCVDVYCLYIEGGLAQKIEYACTLKTDSTKSCYYVPTISLDDEIDLNTVPTNSNGTILFEDLTKQQIEEDQFFGSFVDPNSQTFGTTGYDNVLYAGNGERLNAIVGRTSANQNIWQLNKAMKNGEEVDLSDICVYAPLDKDGIVVVFDIQYQNGGTVFDHDDGDYAFKFLIKFDGLYPEDCAEVYEL